MNISEIVIDSLVYPLLELKKFLILGILILISNLYSVPQLIGIQNIGLIILLHIIGIITVLVAQGYAFRNIKNSLEDIAKLPEFNNWTEMFRDGIKVFIVSIVYILPAILILAFQLLFISLLYLIIIVPILAMAIAYMANNDSKLINAFRFREILHRIGNVGWGNLIKWYIVNVIIFIIMSIIVVSITLALSKIKSDISTDVITLILSLILTPYLYLYISRSIALVYKSGYKSK